MGGSIPPQLLGERRRVFPIAGHGTGYTVATSVSVTWIGGGDPVAQSVIERLVRRASTAVDAAERLQHLLRAGASLRYPPIALVATDAAGHEVVVHGDVQVVASGVTYADGTAPAEPVAWAGAAGVPVRHRVDALTAVAIGPVDAGTLDAGVGVTLTDLRAGTIASAGVVITWARRPAVPQKPAPSNPAPPNTAPPNTVGDVSPGEDPADAGHVRCDRGHDNDPSVGFCVQCGIVMRRDGDASLPRPRPPLAVLQFDTGDRFGIDGDVVIGRDPLDDDAVANGAALALVPGGDVSGLSRSHALLRVDGRRVDLLDRGSLNGTFQWDAATSTWIRLAPGAAIEIVPGDVIAFGRRTATLEPTLHSGR